MPSLADELHAVDKIYAAREGNVVISGYHELIKVNQFFINHPASNHENTKMIQLKIAAEIGLIITATLISNNSEEIECFFAST